MNKPAIKQMENQIKRRFKKLAGYIDAYHRLTLQEGGEKWERADNARKYVNRLDGFYDDFVKETDESFVYPTKSDEKSDKKD